MSKAKILLGLGLFWGLFAAMSPLCADEADQTQISNGLPNPSARFHPDSTNVNVFADMRFDF